MILARDLYLGTAAIGGGGATVQATNNQYVISSRLYWGTNGILSISCAAAGYYNDIIYPMANRGSRLLSYVPYFDPKPYTIPTAITSLPGYGLSMPDGSSPNELNFETKQYIQRCELAPNGSGFTYVRALATPVTTDVSAYLTDDYFKIFVQGGGEIEFVNAYEEPVPSDITFLLAPR